MQNRAYSVLEIKSLEQDQRRLRGTATTPKTDHMGDIIEPKGIRFKNPMPLLWQHDHKAPVGWVTFREATDVGIEFEAQIANVSEEGTLKSRLDEAWQSVKTGLVPAVSIGFKPNKDGYEWMKDGDGIRFSDITVFELSLVTIPANSDCTISQIRSFDQIQLAASGRTLDGYERPVKPPGVTGKPKKDKAMPKTVAERISAFEATRAAKAAAMEKLIITDDESTMSPEDQEKYDTLVQEVKAIDGDLDRLRAYEKTIKQSAIVVDPNANAAEVGQMPASGNGSLATGFVPRVRVIQPKVEPWQPFVRMILTMAYAKGDTTKAVNYAKQWQDHTPEVAFCAAHDIRMLMEMATRAAIPVGTTTSSDWASPLITYNQMASLFAEILRPLTIIGRAPLRRVPFNIQLPVAVTGTTVGWVGELAPKPVSQMTFSSVTLRWAKAAGIVVLSDELIRFSSPSAEAVVRDDLMRQMIQFLDRQFIDPAVAEVTNVSPASITNGVSATVPTGSDAAAFRTDITTLLNTFLSNNLSMNSAFWIMTQQQAAKISMMNNTFSTPVYPTVSTTGGTLLGFPVIASENLPSTTGSPVEGYPIILAAGDEIMLADDGVTLIDASNQASVQVDSAPDSPPTASTAYVSLWQTNSTALRAERWINWKKRRSTAVAYIQSAKYA
jgi:HK97 family phage major capsid protein/HK97 family phage prohead protease